MKTVAELAREMNVSVQTVYRRLGKTDKSYTEKINGVTYITDAGIEAFTKGSTDVKQVLNGDKQALNDDKEMLNDDKQTLNGVKQTLNGVKQEVEDDVKQGEENVKHDKDDEIIFLRDQNRYLQEELIRSLEHSRDQADKIASQADRIVSLAEQLAELIRNNQMLLGAEQSRTLISSEAKEQMDQIIEMPKKRRFFSFFSR